MADEQPAGSGTKLSTSTTSRTPLLPSDQDAGTLLEADLPSTLTGHTGGGDLQMPVAPQAWSVTPRADPGSGQVAELDHRQVMHPSGHLSARDVAQLAGDCQLEASTGHVTIQAPGTSGVVKGVEQHVYKAPVHHVHYNIFPPTQQAFDALCRGRAAQLPESSAQSALPLPEAPPPPKRLRLSAQPQAPAAVPQLPAAQPPPVDAVMSPEPRGESQAASQSCPAAEPQGGRPVMEETASGQSSSSLASSQRPQSRTEAATASGEQGQAWAAGQRPDPASLPGDQQLIRLDHVTVTGRNISGEFKAVDLKVEHHHWPPTQAPAAAAEQTRATGQCPDPVSLPEESKKLKNLLANTQQLINTHCPQGYVDTAALGEMLEGLQQQGVCLVQGLPGHGKTALALQAMGRLAASHHLKPLRLDSPDQWRWIPGETEPDTTQAQQQQQQPPLTGERDPQDCNEGVSPKSRRYIVLVDDIFGKGNYNKSRSESWGEIFDLMLAKVRAGQVKLILVSRAHILQACKEGMSEHSLFSDAQKIDLRKTQYWSEEDNEEILQQFLTQHKVQLATPMQDIAKAAAKCTEIGFPQCCLYFATNPDAQKEGCKFFEHPVSFLQRQLKSLQENDAKSYLLLVLAWLGGDCLSAEDAAADQTRLRDICRLFGVKEELTLTEIEATAQNLCGVYLQEVEEGVFKLKHHSLHDCLVVAVCKANLKRALEVCSIAQVCEYIHTKGSSGGHAGLTYTVRRSQWPLLAARLVKAMTSEEVEEALRHPSLQDKDFVSELVTKNLEPSQGLQLFQRKLEHNEHLNMENEGVSYHVVKTLTFLAIILQGPRYLSNYLLASKEATGLSEKDGSTFLSEALVSACFVGDSTMVRRLLDRKAQGTEEAFLAAGLCESDDVDTLQALCNHPSSTALTHGVHLHMLHHCCVRGRLQSVQYLLTEAKPDQCQHYLDDVITFLIERTHPDNYLKFPCHLAQILSALKAAGAKISKQNISLMTAAGHPDSFALKELLSDNITQEEMCNEKKENLLHESAQWGSLQCLQVLLESPQTSCLDINALDHRKQSPLHRAVEGNHLRVAEFLLQHGADPDGGVGLHGRSDITNSSESCVADEKGDATHPKLQDSQVVCEGTTPLHLAAHHHHLSLMELLIKHKARTDVLNKKQRTPLQEYADTRRERNPNEDFLRQRVECLITKKTQDIDHQDQNGATALHLAAQNSLLSLVETLLGLKARTDVRDSQQRTALHAFAASTDNSWEAKARKKMMACLVAATGDINQADQEGMTPLHVAAKCDNLSMMEVLIEEGARLDAVDRYKRSVLHAYLDRACCCNVRLSERRHQLEEALLAKIPDLDSADAEGHTALYMAAHCGHMSLVGKLTQRSCNVILRESQDRTLSHTYATSGRQQSALAEQGSTVTQWMKKPLTEAAVPEESEINRQNIKGQTLLHVAASSRHWVLMELLLQHGARVDVLDDFGQTPVHCYAENMFKPDVSTDQNSKERVERLIVKKLSEVGNVNHQDKNGNSVLHFACGKGHWNLAESLISHGARMDLLDKNGQTPVHCRAESVYTAELSADNITKERVEKLMVKKLSEVGNINHQDKNGCSILHLACGKGRWNLVESLLQHGARVDLLDCHSRTPLHWAVYMCTSMQHREQKHRVEELLVQRMPAEGKVDINTQDFRGTTVLHLAAVRNNMSLMKLLMKRHARCDLLDQRGMSALHCLARIQHFQYGTSAMDDVAQWLLDSSDIMAKANCGCTPLDRVLSDDLNSILTGALEARITSQTGQKAVRNPCDHCNNWLYDTFYEPKVGPVSQSRECTAPKHHRPFTVRCIKCSRPFKRLPGRRDNCYDLQQ